MKIGGVPQPRHRQWFAKQLSPRQAAEIAVRGLASQTDPPVGSAALALARFRAELRRALALAPPPPPSQAQAMFPWILLVIVNAQPLVLAGFRDEATCEVVRAALHANGPLLCRKATRA